MLTTSRDGGAAWTTPVAMAVEGTDKTFRITSPPVEDADGSWLVAAVLGGQGDRLRAGVLRSHDCGRAWRLRAECPKPAGGKHWVEPSVAATRDGRWVVLARETDASDRGRKIVVMVSGDQGKTWCEPRDTGLNGRRAEIVELLEEFFLAVAEGDEGKLETALAWDDLSHFVVRNLACAYCVRVDGRKYLARASGVDLAGEFNNLAQVPLVAEETAAARREATARLPASHSAFRFRGDWKRVEDGQGDRAMTSNESSASVEVEFEGPVAMLVDTCGSADYFDLSGSANRKVGDEHHVCAFVERCGLLAPGLGFGIVVVGRFGLLGNGDQQDQACAVLGTQRDRRPGQGLDDCPARRLQRRSL